MAMLNFFLGKRGFDLFNFIQNIHHGTSIDYTVTNCNNFFVYFLGQISYVSFALTKEEQMNVHNPHIRRHPDILDKDFAVFEKVKEIFEACESDAL